MGKKILSEFQIHDMNLTYLQDEKNGIVGIQLVPLDKFAKIVKEKEYIPEPLIQVKLVGDDYPFGFSQGRTMRNAETVRKMEYVSQTVKKQNNTATQIVTTLQDARGYTYEHIVCYDTRSDALEFSTAMVNNSSEPIMIEMLSSFTLGGMTPFIDKEAEESLVLHRILSTWSAEGRLVSTPIEELQLEPSWQKFSANSLRFGQIGSMPVRGYFPFAAIEDTKTGVTWCVQLTHASSWQIEAYRKDFALVLSGGIADREFGHWSKTLQPKEKFVTPTAVVTTVSGNIDTAAGRITQNMRKTLSLPEVEKAMPLGFNEFCTTWGKPNEKLIESIAETLKGMGIEYFVIDAGWYADASRGWENNIGEWLVSDELFPSGMEKTIKTIRNCNMRPGIWFEFEVVARDSVTFQISEKLLKRDGKPITSGNRRFWDMRKPEVQEYLTKKVICFLKKYDFEYLKVDYNENIGIGCEGAESLGEGLREQILATQSFFKRIHSEMPQLVIESCSSGGHRLVPSFLELSSIASFSDAHECDEIPIIAANMHRVILPRQSLIWAVLKENSPLKKIYYQIASTMLGRLCLSGDITTLTEPQWKITKDGMNFYNKVSHIIDNGVTTRYGSQIKSYRKPKGWQGVVRTNLDKKEKLVVIHTFHEFKNDIKIPLQGYFNISGIYAREGLNAKVVDDTLIVNGLLDFDGMAVWIKK